MPDVTPFMTKLRDDIMKEREVGESTANQYIRTLFSLNDKHLFTSLTWLKNTDEIKRRLSEFAPTTQTGYVASIVSVLSLFKSKAGYKKVYQFWADLMADNKKNKLGVKEPNTKSAKQEANWISWEEVQDVKAKLFRYVPKTGKTITPQQQEDLLYYTILSLYTDVPPRRNQDYADMYVVNSLPEDVDKSKNYYDKSKQEFVFNKYKTAKSSGEQKVDVPESLQKTLALYLKYHPKPDGDDYPLLVKNNSKVSANSITRILNQIFHKKIGASMLRHIYLTSKYGDKVNEMSKDADAMGHSVAEQKEYVLTESAK